MGAEQKHCLYCCRPFDGRGRCCSKWCARKVNGKVSWVSRSRNLARTRIMARLQKQHKHDRRFRAAALADDPLPYFQEVFGVDVANLPEPSHGDTLIV